MVAGAIRLRNGGLSGPPFLLLGLAWSIGIGILLLDKPFIPEFAGPLDVCHHVPAEKMNVIVASDTDKEQTTSAGGLASYEAAELG